MQRWAGLSLQICLQLNLFSLMFVAGVRPFTSRQQNLKETANEFLILVSNHLLFLFSNFCLDEEFKFYYAGWIYVAVVSLCILFNVFYRTKQSIHFLRLHLIRSCRRLQYRLKQPTQPPRIETSKQTSSEISVSNESSEESSEPSVSSLNLYNKQPIGFDLNAWYLKIKENEAYVNKYLRKRSDEDIFSDKSEENERRQSERSGQSTPKFKK